jgi:hypothetical protein
MIEAERNFEEFWRELGSLLVSARSGEDLFNQYRDRNSLFDLPQAAGIRRENYRDYLRHALPRTVVLVVGEAAGPWECRFSGIPFTGELQLLNPDFPIAGKRSSLDVPVRPIRKKPPFTSGSAVMFWEAMLPYYPGFVLWNALPFHPHRPGNPLSVRAPRKKRYSGSCRG